MQKRRPKSRRVPEAARTHRITDHSLTILATLARYRLLPTSLLVRLVPGNERVLQRHLRNLYDAGLVSRLALHRGGEFIYLLDHPDALRLLAQRRDIAPENLPWEVVRNNREKGYGAGRPSPGQLLFLEHELMLSRFHAMLELGCRQSRGQVQLAVWLQGARINSRFETTKVTYNPTQQSWHEHEATEWVSHTPDAFFSLRVPGQEGRKRYRHYFYEADRKTTSTTDFTQKLRKHFHFVVKHKKHQQVYEVPRIRAVLTETVDNAWADRLRQAAAHPVVSGQKPSQLFWFTSSEIFEKADKAVGGQPLYLSRPEVILQKLWVTPVNDEPVSLLPAASPLGRRRGRPGG